MSNQVKILYPSVLNNFFAKYHFFLALLLLVTYISLYAPISIASSNKAASSDSSALLNLEIAGVSLNTPPEKVADKLAANGYVQSGETTFLKETPLPGGRKALYRIEVENHASERSITYSRTESGGRVKSPMTRSHDLPEDEQVWTKALYAAVCENVRDETKQSRACKPLQNGTIGFGQGSILEITDQLGAQLDASGPSTAAKIIHSKR
jgi:hypothetical protein